jgi:enterochelin esterase family protein
MELIIKPPGFARSLVSDLTDMHRSPRPLDGAGEPLTFSLPDDVYFEYAFLDEAGKMRADPANPLWADNPWYAEVSAVTGPAYAPDPFYLQAAARPDAGQLDRWRLESAALGQLRRVTIWTPAGAQDAALPAILVQDGQAFMRIGQVTRVLDALLAAGRVPPVRLVLIEPVDRETEYMWSEAYQAFVLDELLPQLAERTPGVTGLYLLGASLGGLASATLALARPGLFSGVATLSGAFLGSPAQRDAYASDESWLLEQIRGGAALPGRWFIATGTIEWLAEVNRDAATALQQRGVQLEFQERHAGHNWTNWRNLLAGALTHLLAGEVATERL